MPFDGIFLSLVTRELRGAAGSRIEKIYEPARDTFVFSLRRSGWRKKLLLTCRTGAARAQFTDLDFPNPDVPPALCAVFRKILCGGIITGFSAAENDRVLTVSVEVGDEMGDRVAYRVVCELFGARGNIILVDPSGKIIDAARRSNLESEERIIQPGAAYVPPAPRVGENPLSVPSGELAEKIISAGGPAVDAVSGTLCGISPLLARELVYRAGADPREPFKAGDRNRLASALLMLKDAAAKGGTPYLLTRGGAAFDFAFFPAGQYGESVTLKAFPSYGELLDAFYRERLNAERRAAEASDLLRALKNRANRAEKKLAAREAELKNCENREKYRVYGELLKVGAGRVEKGAEGARVTNYYDPDLGEITIPLRPSLSPAGNAARYFKEYKKLSTAAGMLSGLINGAKNELAYIDSIFDNLSRAETREDFAEIRAEMAAAGYVAPRDTRRSVSPSRPLTFKTDGGFTVLVGKNNTQNDIITVKLAKKEDLWFHVKQMPGAHVLLVTGGREPPNGDKLYAARLAARYSKAANAGKVAVDMVRARYVKKPAGAKPGMVIFKNQTTVYVSPAEEKPAAKERCHA